MNRLLYQLSYAAMLVGSVSEPPKLNKKYYSRKNGNVKHFVLFSDKLCDNLPHSSFKNKKRLALQVAFYFGDPYGNRTHVTAVKGRCLNRLTNGPGSGNLIRTDDIPGMNRLLYQLSYAAILVKIDLGAAET